METPCYADARNVDSPLCGRPLYQDAPYMDRPRRRHPVTHTPGMQTPRYADVPFNVDAPLLRSRSYSDGPFYSLLPFMQRPPFIGTPPLIWTPPLM